MKHLKRLFKRIIIRLDRFVHKLPFKQWRYLFDNYQCIYNLANYAILYKWQIITEDIQFGNREYLHDAGGFMSMHEHYGFEIYGAELEYIFPKECERMNNILEFYDKNSNN